MGFLGKLFKGPEPDMEKSAANAKKMRQLFNHVVEDGDDYRLIFGYTEDVSRFNYGFVHGSKTKIGNLIVGWNEDSQTIAVVPTVPDLSGCSDPSFYRRPEILKAYRSKYPSDAFVIYPDKKGYIGINAYDWLDDESLYVYVSQEDELAAFTDFFCPYIHTHESNNTADNNVFLIVCLFKNLINYSATSVISSFCISSLTLSDKTLHTDAISSFLFSRLISFTP